MAEDMELDLRGRTPVPTNFRWHAVTMNAPDGTNENFVVLQIETAQGVNTYFLPKEVAIKVAMGLGTYARAIPDEAPAAGLIVPDVDMSEVVKHLNNGKGGAS